jgi:murein DD-endopeptidase MepM/ murein hydrolase activator NlpD
MITLLYPIKTPRISQRFKGNFKLKNGEWVYKNKDGSKGIHGALDITNYTGRNKGEPVLACAKGEVIETKANYGVVIKHVFGGVTYFSRYWHLLSFTVKKGQQVEVGEVIGFMGGDPKDDVPDGGITTAPHLHFDFYYRTYLHESRIDPENTEGMQILPHAEYFKTPLVPDWQTEALAWAEQNDIIFYPELSPFSKEQTAWLAEVLRKFEKHLINQND